MTPTVCLYIRVLVLWAGCGHTAQTCACAESLKRGSLKLGGGANRATPPPPRQIFGV